MNKFESILFAVIIGEFVFICIQIGLLYSSPMHDYDPNMQLSAHELLDCGRHKIPEKRLTWNLLDTCVDQANIRKVRAGRMPFIFRKSPPIAWVFKFWDKKNMFMAPKYEKMTPIDRAYVVIHECTHLMLNSEDHAYHWQEKFDNLTTQEHANNADSFLVELFQHCG